MHRQSGLSFKLGSAAVSAGLQWGNALLHFQLFWAVTGAGTAEGTGAQSQPKEWKTLVEEKGAASAGMGEVSPEQGDFPARCSGALREGMSGLAPACRARLCWDAQEEDCEPMGSPALGQPLPCAQCSGL